MQHVCRYHPSVKWHQYFFNAVCLQQNTGVQLVYDTRVHSPHKPVGLVVLIPGVELYMPFNLQTRQVSDKTLVNTGKLITL